MSDGLIDILKVEVATLHKMCADHERENERLVWRLEAARHEARAATKLVLEHQAKNNHLHAEIERLRAALIRLRDCDWVITLPDRMDAVREIAREALGDD